MLNPALALVLAAIIPTPDAKITRVTVYADRAEVVREVTLQVPAGPSQVKFDAIPLGVDPDSIRVSGRGIPTTIGAVEVHQEAHEAGVSPDFKTADAEVKRLELEIAQLEAQEAINVNLREYLDSLRAENAEKQGEQIALGKPDPLALKSMLDFLREGYQTLAEQDLERKPKGQELKEALAVARAKRDAARPKGGIRSRVALVEVMASNAGTLQLELSYVTPGAYWRPSYRTTLEASKGEVDLISEAVVVQQTGEEWQNVGMVLSTASPSRGLESPVLESWYLQAFRESDLSRAAKGGNVAEMVAVSGSDGRSYENVLTLPKAAPSPIAPKKREAAWESAALVHTDYNVAFAVPGKSDIPPDGAEHRVTLQRDTLKSELAYRVVPSEEEAAYALALTKGPSDRPLLSGDMRVLAGNAYLGAFTVPETPPGAELRIPFGIDNRIKVKRVVLPEAHSSEGFVGRDRQAVFAYRTTIENFRDLPVTLAVEERLPKSQDERVKVEVLDKTTPGFVEIQDRPGVINWKLTLAPKEKKEITLQYSVRWPKDLLIPGL